MVGSRGSWLLTSGYSLHEEIFAGLCGRSPLGMRMSKLAPGDRFRELVAGDEITQIVGGYDGLTAKLIERAGGECVYMSGSAVSTSVHGGPDVGLTTMSEMVDRARGFVEAVDVPVFCDADTGYGNPLNVRRTVEQYEQAGVAAIHLEDQEFPKQCGHFEGKRVIPTEEMVEKLRAAVDAREDLVIVARTDAAAVHGLDAALERAEAYAEAGAEVLFVEAPRSRGEIRQITDRFTELPILINLVAGGKTPLVPAAGLAELGVDIVLFPTAGQRAVINTLADVYSTILSDGTQRNIRDQLASWEERNAVTGLAEIRELEARYAVNRDS